TYCTDLFRREVQGGRRITEQCRRFWRGIAPALGAVDRAQVVAGVVSVAAPTAREAGVELRADGGQDLPTVRSNTEVIQHVVLNLLVNAIQSCEGRGGRVDLRFQGDSSEVRIEIEDTGCGISPQRREHLFEPFRSRKPTGTGLGLFLSRSFMRRFGGEVRLLRSQPGAGSCFEICFPAVQAPPHDPRPPTPEDPAGR
ncbi:MAG: HAMP domain-containing histidine kinase, partial [Planctomycetes bacterium]|nr:HAMP domain-containing histidine kinase [Planctomycetota bacterium]